MESCVDLTGAMIEGKIEDSTLANPITSSQAWMSVGDVMSKNVATVSPNQDVVDAAMEMAQDGISCVIVTEKGAVVGILTETDFLRKVVGKGDSTGKIKIADVMSESVESISADLSVLEAGRVMQEKHVRRLPVLDGSALVGIVTQTDLTRALTSFGHWRDVGEIMSRAVSEIQVGASVAMAAKLMNISKISSIVVMKDDDVVGVLTQRDVLKKVIAKKKDPKAIKVEEAMSSPVISVPPSYSVFSASKTMEDLNIRRLVIMNDKTVCGIITQTDIFRAVENKLQAEEEKQQALLKQSPSCIFSTDLQGVTSYVNPAFARIFEVSDPQELINQPFLAERFWCDPKERTAFLKDHQNWGFESQELNLKTAQGQELFVTVFSHFTTGSHGEINGREGIVCDITARKKAEAELKATHQELLETSRQAGSAETTTKILQRVECAFDSIMESATRINEMLLYSDNQNLNKNTEEHHSPDRGTSSAGKPEGEVLLEGKARAADIRKELNTLVEEVNHIRNIIEVPER
jgi:PAS domain S-box-containing protein